MTLKLNIYVVKNGKKVYNYIRMLINENGGSMNLPNKLTIARMCAIPLVIIVSLIKPLQTVFNNFNLQFLILLVVFVLASITDFLDGHIARKNNIVTNFGKFMDPLADKLLVMSTLIILLELGNFSAFGVSFGFVIIIILARELAITGLRTLAADNGVVIAASKLGKIKTVSQMIMIIYILGVNIFNVPVDNLINNIIITILVTFATLMTLVSGIDYFVKNKGVLKEH